MVTVKYILFVVPFFIHGTDSWPQDPTDTSSAESQNVPEKDDLGSYDFGDFNQYGDALKEYDEYVQQSGVYTTQAYEYPPDITGTENTEDSVDFVDYYAPEYTSLEKPTPAYDVLDLEDFSGLGTNSPLEVIKSPQGESQFESPWALLVVPVFHIDVFLLPERHGDGNNEETLLIDSFQIELGGLGLASFPFDDHNKLLSQPDLPDVTDVSYDEFQYDDSPVYGNMLDAASKADMYNTADELADLTTLDYPGIDHDNYWVNWLFTIPANEIGNAIVR